MDNRVNYCYLLTSSSASPFIEEMDEEDYKEFISDFKQNNETE